jgi:hypothetical protein
MWTILGRVFQVAILVLGVWKFWELLNQWFYMGESHWCKKCGSVWTARSPR